MTSLRITIAITLILTIILAGLTYALSETSTAERNDAADTPLRPRVAAVKPMATVIAAGADISHVVVKFRDDASVRLRSGVLSTSTGSNVGDADNALRSFLNSGRCRRLFDGIDEMKLDSDRAQLQPAKGQALADLNGYYRVDVSDPTEAQALINDLNRLDCVEIAYFQPKPEEAGDIDPPTPDYQPNQDYREAAPAGVDADYANTLAGGDGSGVKIIDIENDWVTTHEDLESALGGVIGVYPGGASSSDHGTAVIGEMIAGNNGYGVTGICPGADIGMISVTTMSTAAAIYTAIDNLEPGDFILVELHAPGPRYNFQSRPDQLGYVCMEYWQANYDAMLYAWARGITVIEPAGNGAEDFDDVLYGSLFDTTYRNSHAIVVGAGYPTASSDDLERQDFSNYGERVNLQGYGSGVYTTGYGIIFDGGGDRNQYYTGTFSGTSSASPIVAGAAACLQGYFEAAYGAALTSDQIRDLLVPTGTPQQGNTSQHIGPRPDLQAAIAAATSPSLMYTSPILIDTSFAAGEAGSVDLWLHNRSTTATLEFGITDDSLAVKTIDWLEAAPGTGAIDPEDSSLVVVTIDATSMEPGLDSYLGLLIVSWGQQGDPLDSTTLVPVYVTIPCDDTTYLATSSDGPEGPTFHWISAKTLGSKIPEASFYGGSSPLDDGSAGPFNVGFKFPFYDTTYNRFFVGVNGGMSFTDTNVNVNSYFGGIDIPGAPFATVVAPFWNDLIFDPIAVPEGGVYRYNDPSYDTLVIEWYHPGSFNNSGDTTTNFEIILTVDGSVVFQYANVGVSGLEQTATIGMGAEECRGLAYYQSTDWPEHAVSPGEAVRFFFTDREWVMTGNVDDIPGLINIADLVYLVTYMFQDGPEPIPFESGNINCTGGIDIADLVLLVTYMFQDGPEPCYYLRPL